MRFALLATSIVLVLLLIASPASARRLTGDELNVHTFAVDRVGRLLARDDARAIRHWGRVQQRQYGESPRAGCRYRFLRIAIAAGHYPRTKAHLRRRIRQWRACVGPQPKWVWGPPIEIRP